MGKKSIRKIYSANVGVENAWGKIRNVIPKNIKSNNKCENINIFLQMKSFAKK